MSGEWKADVYAANSKGQAIWANELIEKIGLRGDESILDIGCGDGKITDALSHLTCGEVVGIDLSGDMIAYAQKSFSKPIFMQMDAQALNFNEQFDVVFSNAALHWAKDHKAILEGVYKALKPNGRAVLQMGGEGNADLFFKAVEQVIPSYAVYFDGFEMPYTFLSDKAYEDILEGMSFRLHTACLIPKDMVHADVKAFRGWIETTWFPYIQRVPFPHKEAFIESCIEAYCALCPFDSEGRVHLGMVRLEVQLSK